MTFFNWIPDDSAQVISPWLALYGGLTVLLTTVTVLWLKNWSAAEAEEARRSIQEELDKEKDSALFSRLSFLHSSGSVGTKDLEMGVLKR